MHREDKRRVQYTGGLITDRSKFDSP